jgi:hypothetical protein
MNLFSGVTCLWAVFFGVLMLLGLPFSLLLLLLPVWIALIFFALRLVLPFLALIAVAILGVIGWLIVSIVKFVTGHK